MNVYVYVYVFTFFPAERQWVYSNIELDYFTTIETATDSFLNHDFISVLFYVYLFNWIVKLVKIILCDFFEILQPTSRHSGLFKDSFICVWKIMQ